MEVYVVGKSVTPITHQYISLFERTLQSPLSSAYVPLSRRNSSITGTPTIKTPSIKLSLSSKFSESETWHPDTAKPVTASSSRLEENNPKLNCLRPNVTNSETCEITKLKPTPKSAHKLYEEEKRVPKLAFSRIKSGGLTRNVGFDSRSVTPEVTSGIRCIEKLGLHDEQKSGQDVIEKSSSVFVDLKSDRCRPLSQSACGFRKHRRKSAHKRRKNHEGSGRASQKHRLKDSPDLQKDCRHNLVCRPTEIYLRNKLPPRTSFFMMKNICNNKNGKGDEVIFPSHPRTSQMTNSNFKSLPSERITKGSSTWNVNKKDPLLSSLDSSLSHKAKKEKQLSMRIQLIHKYGNEDVLAKHLEMRRKREAVEKHEKKFLEAQTATKLKQVQRAKIYALNNLMTKLEQEQFEEYKRSVGSV